MTGSLQSDGLPPTGHEVFAETSGIQGLPVLILLSDEFIWSLADLERNTEINE